MADQGAPGSPGSPGSPGEPRFQVVAGHPTDEEAAAVAAVLSVLAGRAQAQADAAPAAAQRSVWADRRRMLLSAPVPGPGAWRRSALPR
jgi:hypothetical protein